MIKIIGLHTRKEGTSVEAFQKYWREVHGPIRARTPGTRQYVQSHPLPETYGGDYHPAYDGVAEGWFDSLEALEEARATPESRAASLSARDLFASSESLIVTEVPIIAAYPSPVERQSMVKYIGFLTRKAGMTVEAFQKYWREVHGPLVVAGLPGMRRYIQSQPLPDTHGSANAPAYDGVPEAWFDNMDSYPRSLGSRRESGRSTDRASTSDTVNFIEPGLIPSMIAREIAIEP